MSIRVQHRIWQFSNAAGTELLVLLALSHYADDTGRAPLLNVESFAGRVRLSVTAARDILMRLERKGELRETSEKVYQIVCAIENLKGREAHT